MGRKPKLTPEVQARICELLNKGAWFKEAAQDAGITERTFYNWMERGEKAKSGLYFQFFQAVEKNCNDAKLFAILTIRRAMGRSWQAAAWFLERRYKDEYGRQRVEHTGKDGGPIEGEFRIVEISDETMERALEHLVEAGEIRMVPPPGEDISAGETDPLHSPQPDV